MQTAAIFIILCYSQFIHFFNYDIHVPNIRQTNAIKICFFKAKKPFVYTTKNHKHLIFFNSLVKQTLLNNKSVNNEMLDTTGEIIYLKNRLPIFKVYFSTQITGSKYNLNQIAYTSKHQNFTNHLSYNIGMMIDEIFYKKRKFPAF